MWARIRWRKFCKRTFAQDFYTCFQPPYTCLISYPGALLFLRRQFCSFSVTNLICWSGLWSRRMKTFNHWGFMYTWSTHTHRLTDTEHSCICVAKCAAFQQRQEVHHMQRRLSRLTCARTHTHHIHTHGCNLLSACRTLGLPELSACWFWTIRRPRAEFVTCIHINVENWVFVYFVISDYWRVFAVWLIKKCVRL